MRALEIDKFTLASLAATLQLYQDLELAERAVPVVSLLATSLDNLRQRAERLAPQLAAAGVGAVEVVACESHVLGTSLATQAVPTACLALAPAARHRRTIGSRPPLRHSGCGGKSSRKQAALGPAQCAAARRHATGRRRRSSQAQAQQPTSSKRKRRARYRLVSCETLNLRPISAICDLGVAALIIKDVESKGWADLTKVPFPTTGG